MNEEELYKLAINNVHRYSLLNEIFAIRDKRFPNEENDYTIKVFGSISLDVLNRYVRFINELVEYENIGTINNLKQLEHNWNELKKYIGSEWYCFDNESVEYDVAKDILNKMQELEDVSNE